MTAEFRMQLMSARADGWHIREGETLLREERVDRREEELRLRSQWMKKLLTRIVAPLFGAGSLALLFLALPARSAFLSVAHWVLFGVSVLYFTALCLSLSRRPNTEWMVHTYLFTDQRAVALDGRGQIADIINRDQIERAVLLQNAITMGRTDDPSGEWSFRISDVDDLSQMYQFVTKIYEGDTP